MTLAPVVQAVTTGGHALLDIGAHRNNVAATETNELGAGQLNVWRNSLPAEELPQTELLQTRGVAFLLPRFGGGRPDNVRCASQYIACAPGRYDWLYLLCAAERRCEDLLAMHYEDGAVDFEPIRVSDFWQGEPAFGEAEAFATSQMHYPFHVQPGIAGTVWLQRVPVTRMAVLVGVCLPDNVAIHVFAATLAPCTWEDTDA